MIARQKGRYKITSSARCKGCGVVRSGKTTSLGWKCRCHVVFFLVPIDTTQRHVADSVGDTKNHVGDIGLVSPHADYVGVVSCRMNTRHVCGVSAKNSTNSSTTIRKIHNRQHNHPHHGERPPPPAARILRLDPIQRNHKVDELLGEGVVEAIY
jgi:hypothetical protein